MKACNTLNDLFGVQLRFRCYLCPIVCDLKKMYHSIKTTIKETHLRRIVYRNMDKRQEIETYGIDKVTFGDRPAAAIASVALRKTAEIHSDIDPEASKKIVNDSYVDDIVTGTENPDDYERITTNMTLILKRGNFQVKGYITAGDVSEEVLALLGSGEYGRVLGVQWDPKNDVFIVHVRINLSPKCKSGHIENDLTIELIPSIVNI